MGSFTSQVYDVSHPEPYCPYSIKLHLTRIVGEWSISHAYKRVINVRFQYLFRYFIKHLLSTKE